MSEVTSVAKRVVDRWVESGVALNPPALPTDVENLRRLLRSDVPTDVRDFYLLANGMPDGVYDDHQVSFWSITKMHEQLGRWGDSEPGFADFLIDSWRFIFRVHQGRVFVVSEGDSMRNLGTFDAFLDTYLTNASDLGIF
jgi:hypothetical protein